MSVWDWTPLHDLRVIVADEVAGEVRGDRERVDVDNCSWRAGCARVSGEGESLEQAVVTQKSNAPHLLG